MGMALSPWRLATLGTQGGGTLTWAQIFPRAHEAMTRGLLEITVQSRQHSRISFSLSGIPEIPGQGTLVGTGVLLPWASRDSDPVSFACLLLMQFLLSSQAGEVWKHPHHLYLWSFEITMITLFKRRVHLITNKQIKKNTQLIFTNIILFPQSGFIIKLLNCLCAY